MEKRAMKVAFFWTRLSGYMNACLKELATRPGVELLVAHQSAADDAPFAADQFSWMTSQVEYKSEPDRAGRRRWLSALRRVSSW